MSQKLRIAIYCSILCCSTILSCSSTKEAIYFNGTGNKVFSGHIESLEPVIHANDLLSINVNSLNPAASEIFNVSNPSSARISNAAATSTVSPVLGYLVDQEGYVLLPFLGKVKAAGLTKKEFQEKVKHELVDKKFLVDPIVDVRYLNYKVSVLGEVARPSVLTIPNEKVTLLEALGLAGDLTIFASRDNVLLIREENGVKRLVRIDLTSDEIFTSPYYYLKSNDIIYVEPNKTKIQNASSTRLWLPVIFSGLTVVFIAIDRLTR